MFIVMCLNVIVISSLRTCFINILIKCAICHSMVSYINYLSTSSLLCSVSSISSAVNYPLQYTVTLLYS